MKNMPTKSAENVLSINIYKGSELLPDAITFRFIIIVLMQLMDGPNLNIFLVIAAPVIKASALPFLALRAVLWETIISYCYAYFVTKNLQKY